MTESTASPTGQELRPARTTSSGSMVGRILSGMGPLLVLIFLFVALLIMAPAFRNSRSHFGWL